MRPLIPVAFLLACTPDFEDPSTIKDLRVLAIVADPPEVLVDVGDLATIETVPPLAELAAKLLEVAANLPDPPTIMVRPLVVDPLGRSIHYRVVACGNQSTTTERGRNMGPGNVRDTISRSVCPSSAQFVDEGDVVAAAGEAELPLAFAFTPTRELLVRAVMADPLGPIFGLPITIELTVSVDAETVVARKRVLFVPRLEPDQMPNRNPTLPGLTFRRQREDQHAPFDPKDPPLVEPGGKLLLTPEIETLESYVARVTDRATGRLSTERVGKETLRYSFFTTSGKFSPRQISTLPSPLRSAPTGSLTSDYRAPTLEVPDRANVWVVSHDERGGSAVNRLWIRLR